VSTLYYPQLTTGSISQFPMRRVRTQRTVVNRSPGGGSVRMPDPEGEVLRWDLNYTGLTDVEAEQICNLFTACEGRLRSFVFLDPCGNLLRWTEQLTESVWQTSLGMAGDLEGPNGRSGAWRVTNAAQASQAISQSVDVPGWFRYTFSVWARSSSTDRIVLRLANSSGSMDLQQPISTTWERVAICGEIAGDEDEIRCSIELPGACAVDVFGPQLEAQRDASGYRRNTAKNGVFLARFDQDSLECTTEGPDNHSTEVSVVTVREVRT
jgi:hypothetical protein